MTYLHFTAVVNDQVCDVLVSLEDYIATGKNPAAYFPPEAKDITDQGEITLLTNRHRHPLPEVFG